MNGTVKFYNEGKGFGFIAGEDGEDYFVHVTFLDPSIRILREGDKVEFEVSEGQKGLQAQNVKLSVEG